MDFEHYRTAGTGSPENKSKEGEEASDATMTKRPQEKNPLLTRTMHRRKIRIVLLLDVPCIEPTPI
eukprot:1966043-Ditylum_brightwellii.AAC.1